MIIVSPLSAVQTLVDEHGVRHVVSLLGPDTPHRQFQGIEQESHLKLTFHDILEPMDGFSHPLPEHAEQLVAFLKSWGRETPILIHCWAGISRSTASAFTALCMLRPNADEQEIAWELRAASPSATPNRLLISYADQLLGRAGRMVTAIESIGRGIDAYEGKPFILKP
jgi:predicted protein tyrosine phosphatase